MNNEQKPQLTIPRVIGCLSFFNADNLEIMRGFADKEFDLAIVDPPYGIDINPNMGIKKGKRNATRQLNGIKIFHHKNTLMSCLGYLKIKLFGAGITSHYRQLNTLYFGIK